jgi:hypothetical protein
MNAQTLLEQAKQRGIRVEMYQGKLSVVFPTGHRPDFIETVRAHKTELLQWFAADHLCKQIQCGEFIGCDRKTAKRIIHILQASQHPLARRAMEHLLQST